MATFVGFGSYQTGNAVLLQDNELIKKDLLNHFMTRKGERVMNMEYGFIGWDLIFELKKPGTKSKLESDARRIIQTDPRVKERSIEIIEQQNGYTVKIELYFIQSTTVDTLEVAFKNQLMVGLGDY